MQNPDLQSPQEATPLNVYFPVPEETILFNENLELEDEFEREKRHNFAFRTKTLMSQCGVPPRIQRSEFAIIPHEIKKLKAFQVFPEKPFGMTGEGGIGKSCALGWAIRKTLSEEMLAFGPARMQKSPKQGMQGLREKVEFEPKEEFVWLNWPEVAIQMKQLASRRDWENPLVSLNPLREKIKNDPDRIVLILDDLGMESIKMEKSYAHEQLELLIDVAYNWECRVFWTSNRAFEDLLDERVYGYRMMSRIAGLSPDVRLPKTLPDLRAQSAYVETTT